MSSATAARSSVLPIFVVVSFLLLSPVLSSESDHKYQAEDPVTLWVNKVGPYNNPQETYNCYSLPLFHPAGSATHKWNGLGEVLGGNELIDSKIQIKFQKNVDKVTICSLELDEAKVRQFKDAIENNYWFEFFMISQSISIHIREVPFSPFECALQPPPWYNQDRVVVNKLSFLLGFLN